MKYVKNKNITTYLDLIIFIIYIYHNQQLYDFFMRICLSNNVFVFT